MTDSGANPSLIETRFKALFIDLNAVKQTIAEQKTPPAVKEILPRRELLAVEKRARQDKKLTQAEEELLVAGASTTLHESIEAQLAEALEDSEYLVTKVLAIDPVIPKILDMLSVKACTVSGLEALVAQIPWLYKDLAKMIVSAKYQRRDSQGKIITGDTLRVALSFFGLENLKRVVPFLVIRRCLPQITDPYPQIKRRIWELAIATAMSCKCLASLNEVNTNQAFTAGMLQNLGVIAVVKLYFRLFDQVQLDALKEAQDTLKHQHHAALAKVKPSGEALLKLIDKYAPTATADIIHRLAFTRLHLHDAFAQLASTQAPEMLSPLSTVLHQGQAYAKYRILKFHDVVNNDEAKTYLRQFSFIMGALALLKTTDMRSIGLETEKSQ